ncbi:MAG: hypothetical protein IPP13_21120 [Kouleothrix sp.]|jgi:hypothetical protein|nr:hypothetical protein [Kouleothrix sp.]
MAKTLRELFVDRVRQSDIFRKILDGQARRQVMLVTAGAGLGKSWLLRVFALEAAGRALPHVQIDFADGQAYDTLSLVRYCRDALGPEHFAALLRAIDEATTARVAVSAGDGQAAPVSVSLGNQNTLNDSPISISDIGTTVIRDNSFVIQTDSPIVRQAIEDRINAAFFACLAELASRTRVVFLFDTYERASLEAERWAAGAADRWVSGQLLARIREGKLPNVAVVLAGRRLPEFGVEWNDVLGRVSLELLECAYITEYLRERRGLANISDAQAEVLCQAVAGNPQVMGLIGDNLAQANQPGNGDDEW